MTSQAVARDSALLVTLDAVVHGYSQIRYRNRRGLLFHVAVARGTLKFPHSHMTSMRKIDMIWHPVDLIPRNFFLLGNIFENLQLFF